MRNLSAIKMGWLLWFFLLAGCIPSASTASFVPDEDPAEPASTPAAQIILPTLIPTIERLTLTPIPTLLPPLNPTELPTLPATSTPVPTAAPTAVPTPAAAPQRIDRTCPEGSPEVPDYLRARTGANPLLPRNPQSGERLWLEKPLPGGGRFLVNTTFPYGYDARGAYLLHNGVDSAAPLGTPVLAVGDGTVVVAQSDAKMLFGWRCDWYGHLVVLELDQMWQGQPVYALYGHVLEINVDPGQKVAAGDQLAEVGFGGAAVVPHLHFELRVGQNDYGFTRNPLLWIRPPESRGVIAGRLVDPNGRPWHGIWLRAVSLDDGETEYITWSYLDDPRSLINSDELLGENFVLADVLPGDYRIYVQIQGINYRADVAVVGGEISMVELKTEFYDENYVPPEIKEEPENDESEASDEGE